MEECLVGLTGCVIIVDNIFVSLSTVEVHDRNFRHYYAIDHWTDWQAGTLNTQCTIVMSDRFYVQDAIDINEDNDDVYMGEHMLTGRNDTLFQPLYKYNLRNM